MKEYILKENEDGTKIYVRDVHHVLLGMLKDIDKVCKAHDIPYWLTGGSALGAVRHKGFIPWDDDADIGMMREDYERFMSVAIKDLPDRYAIHNFARDKRFNVCVPTKIRLKNTFVEEYNVLLKNRCDDCDGIFIDVFVVDYMAKDTRHDLPPRLKSTMMMLGITLLENLHMNPVNMKKRFLKNAKRYGQKYRDSNMVGYDLTWTFNPPLHPIRYSYDSVFPVKYVPFEDTLLPIPNDPKPMLDIEVSVNHMSYPPQKDQKPKHIKDVTL